MGIAWQKKAAADAAVFLRIVRIEQGRGEVAFARIGQEHNNCFALVFWAFGKTQRRMQRCSGGDAAENAFAPGKRAPGGKRFLVPDGENFVVDGCIQHLGDKSCTDALDAVFTRPSLGEHGEPAGSTATILMSGFFSRRYFPTPVIVPPVPTPAMKRSTLPSVSSHISGPVVS